jgi:hypothetical protein
LGAKAVYGHEKRQSRVDQGRELDHKNAPFWALCQNTQFGIINDQNRVGSHVRPSNSTLFP